MLAALGFKAILLLLSGTEAAWSLPSLPSRRPILTGLAGGLVAQPFAQVRAEEELPERNTQEAFDYFKSARPDTYLDSLKSPTPDGPIVDIINILDAPTKKYLSEIMNKLDKETGIKFRMVCTPTGVRNNRARSTTFIRPLLKAWNLSGDNSILMLVEVPSLTSAAAIQASQSQSDPQTLIIDSVGKDFIIKYDFSIAREYFQAVDDKFGNLEYVQKLGKDGKQVAIRHAVENIAASMWYQEDWRVKTKNEMPPKLVYKIFPENIVQAILVLHGFDVEIPKV